MSVHSFSLVGKGFHHDPVNAASSILAWLITEDIVAATPSDCILNVNKLGYACSTGAAKVVNEPEFLPFDTLINGLELTTVKTVFHTGEHGLDESYCPQCGVSNVDQILNCIGEWYKREDYHLTCASCGNVVALHDWRISPPWGFSNLGLTFWNWPSLTDQFVTYIESRVNFPLVVVHQHL